MMTLTQPVVDVTNVFWRFVAAVVHLPYDKLQKTDMFQVMKDCVVHEKQFVLVFDGIQFFHTNINTLMYDTLEYLKGKSQYVDEAELLGRALHKIESVLESDEMMEMFGSLCSLH